MVGGDETRTGARGRGRGGGGWGKAGACEVKRDEQIAGGLRSQGSVTVTLSLPCDGGGGSRFGATAAAGWVGLLSLSWDRVESFFFFVQEMERRASETACTGARWCAALVLGDRPYAVLPCGPPRINATCIENNVLHQKYK